MSIKIYDAFRYEGTLDQVVRILGGLRPQVHAIARYGFTESVARLIEERIDSLCAAGKAPEKDFLWQVFQDLAEIEQQIARNIRLPRFDWSCQVVLIPAEGYCLGMVFAEQPALIERVLQTEGFCEYHYQNNTDRPDEISEQAWQARRDAWAAATEEFTHSPAAVGVTMDLANQYSPFPSAEDSAEELSVHWRSPRQRAISLIRDRVAEEVYIQKDELIKAGKSVFEYMEQRCRNILDDPKHRADIEALAARLPDLAEDDSLIFSPASDAA